MPLSVCVLATATSGRALNDAPGLSASDPSPVVGVVDIPAVGRVETIQLSLPPRSGQLSPGSPRMVAFEDLGDSSVPLSPNRVQAGRSQEVPEDGSLFNVSPVSPGFLMRLSGAAGQHPEAGLLLPSFIRCRLVSHICRVSLRFRLCWHRGRPLVRRGGLCYGPDCGHCSGGAI